MQRISAHAQTHARTHLARGNAFRGYTQYEDAILEYDQALQYYSALISPQLDSTAARIYCERATTHALMGNLKDAIADYEQVILSKDKWLSLDAYNNRAIIYFDLGNFGRGLQDLHAAFEIDPTYPGILHNKRQMTALVDKRADEIIADTIAKLSTRVGFFSNPNPPATNDSELDSSVPSKMPISKLLNPMSTS